MSIKAKGMVYLQICSSNHTPISSANSFYWLYTLLLPFNPEICENRKSIQPALAVIGCVHIWDEIFFHRKYKSLRTFGKFFKKILFSWITVNSGISGHETTPPLPIMQAGAFDRDIHKHLKLRAATLIIACTATGYHSDKTNYWPIRLRHLHIPAFARRFAPLP